ncbi:MAG: alpha/beta hydrolase [Planctomycetota bacterium]
MLRFKFLLTGCLLLTCLPATVVAQSKRFQKSPEQAGAIVEVYKETVDAKGKPVSLNAYVFMPEGHKPTDQRSAIVFFFGGGWNSGTPNQFVEHCKYLSKRGMVAVTADYRVKSRQGTLAKECVADGKSAVRWLRENADRLGIDPNRIVAGGGSAGGHVAACTGTVSGYDESGENLDVSSRPNAMALFNPATVLASIEGRTKLDTKRTAELPKRLGTEPKDLSPYHNISDETPPAILFHGDADKTVPHWTAEAFEQAMKSAGNVCQLCTFEGQGHGFFNFGRGNNSNYEKTIDQLEQFLVEQGFLEPR